MKIFIKSIAFFSLFGLFICTTFLTTSCNQKLSNNDSLDVCKALMEKQNWCSMAMDCKGFSKFSNSHLYSPFIAEGEKGEIGIIIPIEAKKYLSYVIIDSTITNKKNVVKILKLSNDKPNGSSDSLNSQNTYQTFSITIDQANCESFELFVQIDEDETGTVYRKKGRGKIIRDTSRLIEEESKEEENKKEESKKEEESNDKK